MSAPVRKSRFQTMMVRAGVEMPAEPEKPKRGGRPKGSAGQRAGRALAADLPGPARAVEDVERVLGGLTADQLDEESAREFDDLRALAFSFARQIMELPLQPNNKNFAKILSVKQAMAQSILTATTRVRPGDFRDKDDDGVGALLEQVRRGDELDDRPLTADEMLN